MRIAKILLAVIFLIFSVGTSCINPFFVQLDYPLSSCPAEGHEAPHLFNRLESVLEVEKGNPECPGFVRYSYTKYKATGGIIGQSRTYVQLLKGKRCDARVLAYFPCSPNHDCRVESPSIDRGRAWAIAQGRALVDVLWSDQGIKAVDGEPVVTAIGDRKALEHWCGSH